MSFSPISGDHHCGSPRRIFPPSLCGDVCWRGLIFALCNDFSVRLVDQESAVHKRNFGDSVPVLEARRTAPKDTAAHACARPRRLL